MLWEVLLDALKDSLLLVPLLLAFHVLIEIIEKHSAKLSESKLIKGKLSPLIGAGIGVLPQCGAGIIATEMYAKKKIPLGALFAVYIATSDEAVPILLSNPQGAGKLIPLLLIKIIAAIGMGYIINAIFPLVPAKRAAEPSEPSENSKETAERGCHKHEIGKEDGVNFFKEYLLHPLRHTAGILVFILIINIILGLIIGYAGEDKLNSFMNKAGYLQPILAAIIGLIPNCASSVAITQMYALGHLSLGGAVAGLTVNAGLAYAVLIKQNKSKKETLLIILGMLAFGTTLGILVHALS